MAEAASFADLWVPFCRKHDIEPRNPESYFSMKGDPTKNKKRSDFVKDRGAKVDDLNKVLKEKGKELIEEQKKIETANLALKKKQDEIDKKLADLTVKEQRADADRRKKEINALTEKLSNRGKVEMQNLLEGHKSALDIKRQEFESNLEKKRKLFEEEMEAKSYTLEKKENELKHMEDKWKTKEQVQE